MAGAPCCRTLPDAALSITDAMRSNVASAQGRPMNCSPIGRPEGSWPTGTEMAGRPTRLACDRLVRERQIGQSRGGSEELRMSRAQSAKQ